MAIFKVEHAINPGTIDPTPFGERLLVIMQASATVTHPGAAGIVGKNLAMRVDTVLQGHDD
ncbi:MAG: hypothetical protein ACR2OJ_13045 [Hyphomicrobiales bacterium]